ncbi:hypothetical protein [Pseudomonas kitaguniensis]|uniref:hypothetical protein n=1 Tax=Pseudomonas kitaguniensis TaxID=2607908 RepID=UPI003BA111F4
MSDTEASSVTLVLPNYIADVLAQWAHADADLIDRSGDSDRQEQRARRADLADDFVRNVLQILPVLSAESDLATALKFRDLVYSEHLAALPK